MEKIAILIAILSITNTLIAFMKEIVALWSAKIQLGRIRNDTPTTSEATQSRPFATDQIMQSSNARRFRWSVLLLHAPVLLLSMGGLCWLAFSPLANAPLTVGVASFIGISLVGVILSCHNMR